MDLPIPPSPRDPISSYRQPGVPMNYTNDRPWAISEILCWIFIVGLALLTAVATALAPADPADPEAHPNLTFAGQYAVGVHQLFDKASPGSATTKELLDSLDKQATAPEDRLRVAIVHGELDGPDKATALLESLDQTTPALRDDITTVKTIYQTHAAPPNWDKFHARYGWFADLALSEGKPETDPLRHAAIDPVHKALALAGAMFGLVALALLTGLTLLIIALVRFAQGKLKTRFDNPLIGGVPLPADRRSYVQAFAIYLGVMLPVAIVLVRLFHLPALVVEGLGLPICFFTALLWPRFAGQTPFQWRAAFGLHTGRGFFREVGSGILGYITGLPILAAGMLLMAVLLNFSTKTPTHPITKFLEAGPWPIFAAFLLASVWAPITEELLFRGALFAHLRERFGFLISAPIVALLFAMIHPQGWVAIPALASIALVLAGIREWRGSIIASMTAHSLHNTLTLAAALLFMS